MKKVVILGAGRSAPFLIRRLVDLGPEQGWETVVADMDLAAAQDRIGGASQARAMTLDATEEPELAAAIKGADVVCNLLAPRFQAAVARHCVEEGAHMVSVSYLSDETRELEGWARDQNVMLLGEMGLDPGIDHMMAMDAVQEVRDQKGKILAFRSFGSGVPAPESMASNPLHYLITWNPWNVATAGRAGAQYMVDGQIRIVPHRRLFLHTWPVEVEGVGTLEAYPNRDSLSYRDHFDLQDVRTMIRGTLRWPGYCDTWSRIVKLGLTNTSLAIPNLAERSPREVVGMFLPLPVPENRVVEAATLFLELNPTGEVIKNLRFLGLFDQEPSGSPGNTTADMLAHLLEHRLAPEPGASDMVILVHQMDVEYPDRPNLCERVTYTMVETGDALGMSAMAKTVGLPTALAAEMMLRGELQLSGCLLPTHDAIYKPVLAQLKEEGLRFTLTREPLGGCDQANGVI